MKNPDFDIQSTAAVKLRLRQAFESHAATSEILITGLSKKDDTGASYRIRVGVSENVRKFKSHREWITTHFEFKAHVARVAKKGTDAALALKTHETNRPKIDKAVVHGTSVTRHGLCEPCLVLQSDEKGCSVPESGRKNWTTGYCWKPSSLFYLQEPKRRLR